MYYSIRLGRRTYHALVIQKTHIIVVIMNTILGSENIVFSLNILCKTCECLPRIWSWKIVKTSWKDSWKSHGFL